MTRGKFLKAFQDLTDLELKVLRYVGQGHTSNEIGQTMGIKGKSVKWHLTNIYYKFPIHYTANKRVTLLKWIEEFVGEI